MQATPHLPLLTAAISPTRRRTITAVVAVTEASLMEILGWIALGFGQKQAPQMHDAFMKVAIENSFRSHHYKSCSSPSCAVVSLFFVFRYSSPPIINNFHFIYGSFGETVP
jgi:hypothetical protein